MTDDLELTIIKDFAARSPITEWLGFSVTRESDAFLFHLEFAERHIGLCGGAFHNAQRADQWQWLLFPADSEIA